MTLRRVDLAARRRGESDRGSRRLSQAVDAKRRLNGRQAEDRSRPARLERSPLRVPDAIVQLLGGRGDAAFQMFGVQDDCAARNAKPIRLGIYAPSAGRSWSQSATWVKSSDIALIETRGGTSHRVASRARRLIAGRVGEIIARREPAGAR